MGEGHLKSSRLYKLSIRFDNRPGREVDSTTRTKDMVLSTRTRFEVSIRRFSSYAQISELSELSLSLEVR